MYEEIIFIADPSDDESGNIVVTANTAGSSVVAAPGHYQTLAPHCGL